MTAITRGTSDYKSGLVVLKPKRFDLNKILPAVS